MNNRSTVLEYFLIKNARIVFSVENNGDIKHFTLTEVSNIRKDKKWNSSCL